MSLPRRATTRATSVSLIVEVLVHEHGLRREPPLRERDVGVAVASPVIEGTAHAVPAATPAVFALILGPWPGSPAVRGKRQVRMKAVRTSEKA